MSRLILCRFLFLILLILVLTSLYLWRNGAPQHHLGMDLRDFPAGIVNQFDEERNFLKFHRCADEGEAFAGSWFITKKHFLSYNTTYDLAEANPELASFLVIETRRSRKAWYPIGALMQTLDVLDFSVIHLSAYERLYRKYQYDIEEAEVIAETRMTMMNAVRSLKVEADKERALKNGTRSFKNLYDSIFSSPSSSESLAMLPWLGSIKGYGHSEISFRMRYLEACVWSIHPLIPHIVIGVASQHDRALLEQSNLPLLEIIVLENLPNPQALPVALVQQVHMGCVGNGRFSKFEYLYYSESDQLLLVKKSARTDIFDFLNKYNRRVLVPHRLVPYPSAIVSLLNRTITSADEWQQLKCCLPRQNCERREDWVPPTDTALPLLNFYGLKTAGGNANFKNEMFRSCKIFPDGGLCP